MGSCIGNDAGPFFPTLESPEEKQSFYSSEDDNSKINSTGLTATLYCCSSSR